MSLKWIVVIDCKYEDGMDAFIRVIVAHAEKTRSIKFICPCLNVVYKCKCGYFETPFYMW